jgi:hypothetical protein
MVRRDALLISQIMSFGEAKMMPFLESSLDSLADGDVSFD